MSKHKNKAQEMYGTHGVPSEPCPCDYLDTNAIFHFIGYLAVTDKPASGELRKLLEPVLKEVK